MFVAAPALAQSSTVDLEGNEPDPIRESAGKIVVLIFVRTDCPVSNRYAPYIQQLSSQYSKVAKFWLVYPDRNTSIAAIHRHLQEYAYKLPAVRDPQRVLVKRAHAQVTPEAAVFDRTGRLVYHGRIDNWYYDFGHARRAPTTHELKDAIRAARMQQPLANPVTSAVGCYISDLQ